MSKFKNGLLLLQNQNLNNVHGILKEAGKLIQNNLYIDFFKTLKNTSKVTRDDYYQLLNSVYSRPHGVCGNIDLHVLLPSSRLIDENVKRCFANPVDVCMMIRESRKTSDKQFEETLKSMYDFDNFDIQYVNAGQSDEINLENVFELNCKQTFPGVVIGGTFDRIHDGHKLLISSALLLADEKLTVGVANGPLLEKKLLKELIDPIDVRISNIVKIIEDYKPGLKHKVVPIYDPCGPSGTDDDLQLLVVSEETIKGGPLVNKTRKENGLPELQVFDINMVGESPTDLSESLNAEGKLSSSAERVRELCQLRKPPNHARKEDNCYVIGVAGGIASGKSSVVKRLENLGAYTVDCDRLGHEAYKPGMPAYLEIVKQFGVDIVNAEDQTIDRKKLGPIVFGDKSKLELLNTIVWPEINRMKHEIIQQVSKEGKYNIVVFEGAVLFEAGWDKEANEVWCCVIPKDEAVKRIIERNGLTEEAALKRISSQMSNDERVNRSHVILSTFWEKEFTQKQCEKAMKLLYERLGLTNTITQSSL